MSSGVIRPLKPIGILVLAIVAGTQVASQDRGPRDRGLSLAVTDLRGLREWDARLTRMERAGELRERKVDDDTVLPGRRHERLDQYYGGVRVFGADISREVADDVVLQVMGRIYEGLDVETVPKLTPEQAAALAEKAAGGQRFAQLPPELVILSRADGSFALVYRVPTITDSELPVVLINALTGVEELRYSNMQRQAAIGRGTGVKGDEKKMSVLASGSTFLASDQMRPPTIVTYDLRGDLYRAKLILNRWITTSTSDVASDSDNRWTDPAVVDAHSYLGWTYDYFFKRFGRRGLDNANHPLRAITHPVKREEASRQTRDDWDSYVLNAFWCGECGPNGDGMMVFGDGLRPNYYYTEDGCNYDYFSGALDIVAHELTHGLTDHSSRLIYRNESGALNEAFSDILGTSAEFYYQAPGSGALKADYLVGEDIITPFTTSATPPLRSLADPRVYGNPDHYSRRYVGPADVAHDWGGIHINSTIASHAFYLAIEGGTNRTSGLAVQGVGGANREQIEKVLYRAFVYMLASSATFSQARAATIQSAKELYGAGSAAERAVTQAWDAVGVL